MINEPYLKDLLYEGTIEIPEDAYRLDVQLNSVKVFQSGMRIKYEVAAEDDHLFQAFQVFSIAHWYNEFNISGFNSQLDEIQFSMRTESAFSNSVYLAVYDHG